MTERRQQGCDVANRSGDLGIDRVAIRRFVGEGDAQPAGVAPSLLRVSPRWRRRDVEARRFRPVDRIQHDGTVAHADADHMTNGKSAPAFATVGAERVACPRRLQSEHAGGGCRYPDRATAVAGMRDRKDAGRDRRSRAARRAARGMRKIPGIAGRTEQTRFCGRHQTEFRGRALSEDGDAGSNKAPGEGAGMVGDVILVDARARGGPRSLKEIEIF